MSKAIQKEKQSKRKIFSFLQKLGSALLLPISLLPIAGIIIGISSLIPEGEAKEIISSIGSIIFQNFPTLVLISISFKFTDNTGESVLFAFLFWIIFLITQSIFIKEDNSIWFWKNLEDYYFTNQLGISSLNTSIFGSIISGLLFSLFYNKLIKFKFNNILLKRMLNTLLLLVVSFLLGLFFLLIWPGIFLGINKFGESITNMPYGINTFTYGMVNRLLLPFGMHSILMPIFLFSPVGGTLMIEGGEIIAQGDSAIWLKLSELNIPLDIARGGGSFTWEGVNYWLSEGTNPGAYQQGFFPIMIFCFPIAGFVMSRKFEDKKHRRLIIIASITPMLTGITEPFEFLFVFISPFLYIFHSVLTGISFMLLDILDVSVWLSSGWFLDVILFGILPELNNSVTNWWWIPIIGPILSVPYLLAFWKNKKISI